MACSVAAQAESRLPCRPHTPPSESALHRSPGPPPPPPPFAPSLRRTGQPRVSSLLCPFWSPPDSLRPEAIMLFQGRARLQNSGALAATGRCPCGVTAALGSSRVDGHGYVPIKHYFQKTRQWSDPTLGPHFAKPGGKHWFSCLPRLTRRPQTGEPFMSHFNAKSQEPYFPAGSIPPRTPCYPDKAKPMLGHRSRQSKPWKAAPACSLISEFPVSTYCVPSSAATPTGDKRQQK